MGSVLKILTLTFIVLTVWSCGNSSTPSGDLNDYMEVEKAVLSDEVKNVFYMIPSPMENVIVFKKAGLEYYGDLLNDPNASSMYDTEIRKAVNLGIYGADLSYATLNNQTQETMFFVSAAKKLAESLGVMKAFDDATIQRIEDNVEDKDSMMHIVSDVYWIADTYLKENESAALSTYIIFGGWLESVYIASCAYLKDSKNNLIRDRILEQKYTIDNLYYITKASSSEDLVELRHDLESLQAVYKTIKVEESEIKRTTKDNVDFLSGSKKVIATDKQVNTLIQRIMGLRKKYTSA